MINQEVFSFEILWCFEWFPTELIGYLKEIFSITSKPLEAHSLARVSVRSARAGQVKTCHALPCWDWSQLSQAALFWYVWMWPRRWLSSSSPSPFLTSPPWSLASSRWINFDKFGALIQLCSRFTNVCGLLRFFLFIQTQQNLTLIMLLVLDS